MVDMYLSYTAASLVNQTLFRSAGCIIEHTNKGSKDGNKGQGSSLYTSLSSLQGYPSAWQINPSGSLRTKRSRDDP